MAKELTISLDAMGGDSAPAAVIGGAEIVRRDTPNIRFLLHGREDVLTDALRPYDALRTISDIHHAENVVEMSDKPSETLRRARKTSSMWCALEAVKEGKSDAALSGGNTGMLMAMSKIIFHTFEGVTRPAIAGLWPSPVGKNVVLDLGATINPSPKQLVQFALMGDVCARILLDTPRPRIGLLNVGVEDIKGTESVREAAEILQGSDDVSFKGFVEGDALGQDVVDVIVTDGFTGNIALKAAEGTARQLASYLRESFTQSLWARLGYLLARGGLQRFRDRIDPRAFNGGVFLGVRGLVLKSHGGSDDVGYAYAIHSAIRCARARLTQQLAEKLTHMPDLHSGEAGARARAPQKPNIKSAAVK